MHHNARLFGLGLLLIASSIFAQPVYRHVDRNGKVTFSDQPPSADAQTAAPRAGPTSVANAELPYELRQVVQRYPVVLYTSEQCGPCGTARSLLITRGVPFNEKTVKTNEDIEALQHLSGQNSLPLVSIGSQQLKGFSDAEWSQYLDVAGYPKSNQLPAGFSNPPAQPLVAQQITRSTPEATSARPTTPLPPAATGPAPSNPAGIRF